MKPIAILNNGPIRRDHPGFFEACGGDLDVLLARAAGLPVAAFADFDAEAGVPLPDPDNFSAVILTGSSAMITDRLPWMEAEAAWIRRHRRQIPMLGICFGHQMLTYALGGEVGWTPSGPEYGTIAVALEPAAANDPIFRKLPPALPAQTAHSQTALRLPADAIGLAHGASGKQAARFDDRIWGVQFHPEFDTAAMRGLFSAERDRFERMGLDVDALTGELVNTPAAASVVGRFIALACGSEATAAAQPAPAS